MTVIINPIADRQVKPTETTSFNLFESFDDPLTTGLVARFELENAALGGGITGVAERGMVYAGRGTVRYFK